MKAKLLLLVLTTSFSMPSRAAEVEPVKWDLTIDGVARETLVQAPAEAKTKLSPVVFVFHGHGGNSRSALRQFAVHENWPEAIVVAMQGLNTPGRLTDPEGKKPGWQASAGVLDDRDLKFFDAVLARLKQEFKADPRRIYSTGHSNGGGFTYLLWAERGNILAAVAPCAAAALRDQQKLKPKPVLHIAGRADPLVKIAWQQAMMENVRKVNQCETAGTPWAPDCTLYKSPIGAPVVTYIHSGGHVVPREAPALVARFFKENVKPEGR